MHPAKYVAHMASVIPVTPVTKSQSATAADFLQAAVPVVLQTQSPS